MGEMQSSYIEQHCARLVPIERETLEKLGEEKGGFFVSLANDWLAINSAVMEAYPGKQCCNLVVLTFWGLFKEVCWFHSFFVAGNYPLLLSRLRFVWESLFRAYFAEHYPIGLCREGDPPRPSPGDKLGRLDGPGQDPRWDTRVYQVPRA